jgi:magnesium chelatase subunit I
VAQFLISKAIRSLFVNYFPDPERFKRKKESNPYEQVINWFNSNNEIDLLLEESNRDYELKLGSITGLPELVKLYYKSLPSEDRLLLMEFVLYGLASYSQLNRLALDSGMLFKDLFSSVFSNDAEEDDPGFSSN